MYLFLLLCPSSSCTCSIFTFHNVSISTITELHQEISVPTLHSTMYLFLLSWRIEQLQSYLSLHSTMYLFLPMKERDIKAIINFTFHNVSISTVLSYYDVVDKDSFTFHNVSISTKFLLNKYRQDKPLHSTMYLFLPNPLENAAVIRVTLHSTMYLFLQYEQFGTLQWDRLYIPQCIYFYYAATSDSFPSTNFTFHNVSISTRDPSGR